MEKAALETSAKPSTGAEQVTGTTSLPTTESTDLKKPTVPFAEMQKSQEAISTIASHANGAVSQDGEKTTSQKINDTYRNGAPVASISNGNGSKTDSKEISASSKPGDAAQPKDTQPSSLDKLGSSQRKPDDEDSYPLISVDSVICVTKGKPCDPQASVPQSTESNTVKSSEPDLSPEVLASVVTTAVVTEAALTLSGTDGLVLNDTRAVCDSRRVEAQVEQQIQRLAAESTKKDQKDTEPHEAAIVNGAVKATVNGELDMSPELDNKTVTSTEQMKHDNLPTKSHTADVAIKDGLVPSSKDIQQSLPASAEKSHDVETGEEPSPLSEEEPAAPTQTLTEVSKTDISAKPTQESEEKVLDNQTQPKEQLRTAEKIPEPTGGPMNGSSSHAVSEDVEQDIINKAVVMHKNLVNAEHSLDLSLAKIDAKPVCVESIPLPESAAVIDTTSDSKASTGQKESREVKGSAETKTEGKEPLKYAVVDMKTKTEPVLKDEEASKAPKPADQTGASLPTADEKALTKDAGKTEQEKLKLEGDSKKNIPAPAAAKHAEEIPKGLTDVPKEVKDVTKEIKDVPKEVKDAPKEIKDAPKEVKDVPKEVKDVPKEVKDVPKEIKDAPKEVKDVSKEIKDTPKEVKDVPKEVKDVPKDVKEVHKEEQPSAVKDAPVTGDIKSVQKHKDVVSIDSSAPVGLSTEKDSDLLPDELMMTNGIPSSMTESMIDFDTVHDETETLHPEDKIIPDDQKIISSPKHVPEKPSSTAAGTESEKKKETSKEVIESKDKVLASDKPHIPAESTAQDKPCEKSDAEISVQSTVDEPRTEIDKISEDKSEKKILDDEKTKSLPTQPQVSQKDDIKKESIPVKDSVSHVTKTDDIDRSVSIKKEEITKPSDKSIINGYTEVDTGKKHEVIDQSCRLSSDLPKTCDVAVGHEPRMIRVAAGNGESEEVDGEQASTEVEVTEDSAGPGGEEGDENGELNGSTTGGSPNGSDERTESRSSSKISTTKPDTPESRTPTAAAGRQSATKESVKSGSATSRSSIPDAIQYEPPERKKSAASDMGRTVTPPEGKLDGTAKSKEISKEPITEEQETKEPISEPGVSKDHEEKKEEVTDDKKLTEGASRPLSAEKDVTKDTGVCKAGEEDKESAPEKAAEAEKKPEIQSKEEEERPKSGDEKLKKESKETDSKVEETTKDEKAEVAETAKEEKYKEPEGEKAEVSLEQQPVIEAAEAKDTEGPKTEEKPEEKSDQTEKPEEPEKEAVTSKEEQPTEIMKEKTEEKGEAVEADKVKEESLDKKSETTTEIEAKGEVPIEIEDEKTAKSKTPEVPAVKVQEPEPSKETAEEASAKQAELAVTDASREPSPQEAAVEAEQKDTVSAETEKQLTDKEPTKETEEEKPDAPSEDIEKSQEESEEDKVETKAKEEGKLPDEESKEAEEESEKIEESKDTEVPKVGEESEKVEEPKDAEVAVIAAEESKKTVEESKEAEEEVKGEEKSEKSEEGGKESEAEAKAEEPEESKPSEEESKEPETVTEAEEMKEKESKEPEKEDTEEEKGTKPEEATIEAEETEESVTDKTKDDQPTEKEAAKSEEKEEDELEKDATPEASLDSGVSSDKNVEEEEKEKKAEGEPKQEAESSTDVEEAKEQSDAEKQIEEEGAEKAAESGEITTEEEKPEDETEGAPVCDETQEEAEEKPSEEPEAEKQDIGKDDKEQKAEEPPKSPVKRIKSPDKAGRRGSLPQLRIVPRGSGGWPHRGIVYIGTLSSLEGVSPLSSQPKPIKTPPSPKKPQKSSSPRKKNGMLSPIKTPKTPGADARKLPPIKAPVGLAPNPNLKNIKSKIGSFDNIKYKPGGGDKKVISMKLDWKATPKIGSLDNTTYKPGAGEGKKHRSKERGHSKDGGDAQTGDGQSPMPPAESESEAEGAMAMAESLIKTEGSEMPSAIAAES